ncbi:MAG: branched-chain amino acid ABC transporter permease [Actinobacteria bacterium ATB1]|nr:branched-chain amino acid ABC transporter permease [Actinobacteria bacterium ATB1]
MEDAIVILVGTVTTGSAVALIAIGLNIVFATTRIVNFAQGGIVVAAGFLAFVLAAPERAGIPVWVAFAIVAATGALLGILIDVVGVAPLGKFDPSVNISWIITTFAIGTLIIPDTVVRLVSGDPQRIPDLVSGVALVTGEAAITWSDIVLVGFAVALMIGIQLMLTRTMLGRAFHAVSQDPVTAGLMGINPRRIVLLSFAIAGFLGAVAAVLIAPKLFVKLDNSVTLAFEGLIAAVLGGLGSVRGALVGAYTVALIGTFAETVLPRAGGSLGDLLIFAALLLTLALKPTGLFGQPVVEKV